MSTQEPSTNALGGCLCGAIRYTCSGAPVFMGNCHCRDCQRTSGSGYIPAMMFPDAQVRISGSPRFHRSIAESGRAIERGFCTECGSQLFTRLEMLPGVIGIKAGTLDEPAHYAPAFDFFVASAAPWDAMSPALPKLPRSPQG